MSRRLDVLLIEDNPGDVRLIEEMLGDAGDRLHRVDLGDSTVEDSRVYSEDRVSDGLERLADVHVDVVLLDLNLPDSTGLDTLTTVVERTEFVPIVVLTGLQDEQLGIEAIQHGAQEYLVKDEVTGTLLVRAIHHAIERTRQERDRARQRAQLAALNTLTRDLVAAETATDVSEYVVEAAGEMLDLPVTAIALYDDEEGVLVPAAATDAAAEVVRADSLLAVGEGAGWQAFTGNDVRRITPPFADGDSAVQSAVTEVAVFPLGTHGVFVTGSTESGGFSEADFGFAETVARTVEATLDRVARERQLHEREATLEAQNRTLERLNRVNDIIRNIAEGLVRASTRREIEAVVCEQLADVGPYELAWIGHHDAVTDEITPREWAGAADGYLDDRAATAEDDPEGWGPAGRAVETHEPQVVNDVLEDRSVVPWRRAALDRGYHACIGLPLVYEDSLYGVLEVYAGQPGVFDDLERAVLTELADIIAYAINAVERKKALVGDEVTELEFIIEETRPGVMELAADLDCEFVVERLVSRPGGEVRAFFSVRGAAAEEVIERERTIPFTDVSLVSADGDSCLFEAGVGETSLITTVLEHGGRVEEASVRDGTGRIVVQLAADAEVREFVEMFRTRYPDAELTAQRTEQRSRRGVLEFTAALNEDLTDRQDEALQTAYFSGYFEQPRERTGSEIAASMGVSQPTFNSHLRAALRKLCRHVYETDAATV